MEGPHLHLGLMGQGFTDEETRPRQKASYKLVVEGISSQPDNSPNGTGVKWTLGLFTPCLSLLDLILSADHTAQFMNKTIHDPWTPRVPILGSRQRIPRWALIDIRTIHWLIWPRLVLIYCQEQWPFTPLISAMSFLSPSMTGHFWGAAKIPPKPQHSATCTSMFSGQSRSGLHCYYCLSFQRTENYGKSFWTLPVLHNLLLI